MIPVLSSSISRVGYDEALRILRIEFHNGTLYQYSNVPGMEHAALLLAGSLGRYFNRHIRNNYPYKRIS
ncbi:KTSC domain-containing protein [Paenibacillus sp. S150]|uniref:KTSC domain-containing protein n=1 Tax=Paenibacillus sp. S150 TaxID=2749826 RepID=UPI001C619A78|nr:KTSC domain-containing protein [Paenibacillus sp. S150]